MVALERERVMVAERDDCIIPLGAPPLEFLEADGSEQAFTTDQFRHDRGDESEHRQTTIQHFCTSVKSPSGFWAGKFHHWLFHVDVVMALKVMRHQAGGCLKCGCCRGCLLLGPARSTPSQMRSRARRAALAGSVSGSFPMVSGGAKSAAVPPAGHFSPSYSGRLSTARCMKRFTSGIGQPSRCSDSAM